MSCRILDTSADNPSLGIHNNYPLWFNADWRAPIDRSNSVMATFLRSPQQQQRYQRSMFDGCRRQWEMWNTMVAMMNDRVLGWLLDCHRFLATASFRRLADVGLCQSPRLVSKATKVARACCCSQTGFLHLPASIHHYRDPSIHQTPHIEPPPTGPRVPLSLSLSLVFFASDRLWSVVLPLRWKH